MKKIFLFMMFIVLWIIYVVCVRAPNENFSAVPEGDNFDRSYKYFNGDDYDNAGL